MDAANQSLQALGPAVVQVWTRDPRAKARTRSGTGLAIGSSEILTCAHVVHQRQDIALGPEQIPCDVIRIELATDLAILRVKEGNHPYPQVELTPDEPHIQLGAPVAVMGWPALERLQYESPITVFGQVALLDATVTVNDRGVRVFVMDLPGLGGMSGGPVIDMATNAIIGLHAGTVRARAEANGPPELRRLEVYERALGYAIPRRSLEAILAEAS